jgi:carboxypeptidase Taq
MAEPWEEFLGLVRELRALEDISGLLSWDQRVMMPVRGAAARAGHQRALAALHHSRLVNPRLGELVRRFEDGELPAGQRRIVERLSRARDHAVRVPARLVDELAEATSAGYDTWLEAREASSFSIFAPALERIVALKVEQAEALGYAGEPYDAHLDLFEEGETVRTTEPMLRGLAEDLAPLLSMVRNSRRTRPQLPRGPYPADAQMRLNREVAETIGYAFDAGRLDVTVHPFEQTVGTGDVRITTRFLPDDVTSGLLATIHECGHAMYEQGLPADLAGTYAGVAASFGLHESQSRFWENHVGRHRAFWEREAGHVAALFPDVPGLDIETLHAACTRVEPSLVRVEADEATYPLHIVLRFELELALFRGELRTGDLPGAFREGLQKHLGVVPANDTEGVLQDVHWSAGLFGYFPSYAIGSVYAASLYRAACDALGGKPAVEESMRVGDFTGLLGWLRDNVHSLGSTMSARDIVGRATGMPASGPIDHTDYIAHLHDRYDAIYAG